MLSAPAQSTFEQNRCGMLEIDAVFVWSASSAGYCEWSLSDVSSHPRKTKDRVNCPAQKAVNEKVLMIVVTKYDIAIIIRYHFFPSSLAISFMILTRSSTNFLCLDC